MFERLGRTVFRRRWWVIGLAAAFMAFGGIWGTQVFGALTTEGFDDPASESSRAVEHAEATLGRTGNDVVVLYSNPGMTVDDPAFQRAVTGTLDTLPNDVVTGVVTYWNTTSPALVSHDRHATYAVLTLAGDDETRRGEGLERIEDELVAPGLTTQVGGITAVSRDIGERVAADIALAETISIPVLLVLLVLVFGSVASASLPLAIGGLAILGAFTALRAMSYLTDVSVFSINVVTILGLGLAIDYGLFMVGRFREEIARGLGVEDAVARTMATADRTVAVSGVTVAVSLAGLLIFPMTFLRSMGFGGLSAVVVAMVAALTVLPALLGILGHRVEALSVRRRRPSSTRVLSLGASFGALVLIFQDGHLSGLLNFTSTGTLEATQPILVLAVVFGLSMDYEVFLMSRIREEYDRTGDNTTAVAVGLQRSGRIITSAALLILVVIGLFSISGITFIKLVGVAMLIAVLVDATIVRALLVPATMRLLGHVNWWAPAPLRRFYARHGLHEGEDPALASPAPVRTAAG